MNRENAQLNGPQVVPSPAVEVMPPAQVSLGTALRYWLKLGFISFGGPAGQISIMHQELVERRRWISEQRFLHALSYCMVLPGPEAQQLATYIGWLLHGARGGIAAGALFVLPSLVILIALSWIYMTWHDLPAITAVLYGIKPAVTAIVLFAAYRIGTRALKSAALWFVAAAAFGAIFFLKVPFPYIVVTAGLIGLIGGRVLPGAFRIGGAHAAAHRRYGAALIDDDTPAPAHARFDWSRSLAYAALGLALWCGFEGMLYVVFGWHGVLTQMGWFFTKAALVTFGGAYAVLPYVYQSSVEHYHWLTPAQMIDGLALGETTPGPLIMVTAFVGFVGGWSTELYARAAGLAGVAGASVATLFTFLPSFLFILVGAPAVERTRNDVAFTAPLTGITAAVVGVILNLAAFFAYHVFFPNGFAGPFEWAAALIGLLAFAALWRLKLGVVAVIGLAAAAGLLYSYLSAALG